MDSFVTSQNNYLQIIQKAQQINEGLLENSHAVNSQVTDDLSYLAQKVTHFKVLVPVMGKFSSGKSTLLNTYLKVILLPDNLNPETAFATELHYSENERLVLHYLDDSPAKEMALSEFDTLQGSPNLYYAQLFINNAQLKQHPDLVLVDMPGFDAKNIAHHKAIACYLNRGDAFINLMPADIPFDASVIEKISEIRLDYSKEVSCLISKSSRRPLGQLQQSITQLEETLSQAWMQPVKVGHIESKDKSRFTLTDFETALKNISSRFDELLCQRYSKPILASINKLEQEVNTLKKYSQSNEAQLQQQVLNAEQAFSLARSELERSLSQLEYNLCSTGKEQLIAQVHMALNAALGQLVNAAKSSQLSTAIAEILQPVLQAGINHLIQAELHKLEQQLEHISSTDYQGTQISITIAPEQKDQLMEMGPIIIATLSSLILSRLGPVGVLLSGFLNSLFSSKQKPQEDQQQKIEQKVRNEVIPQAANHAIEHIQTQLEQAARQLKAQVMASFEQDKIAHKQKLAELQQQLQEDKTRFAEQQSRFTAALLELDQLKSTLQQAAVTAGNANELTLEIV